mmetsp:Transcript_14522/g.45651  ORF Transcript_14522/g.45651 Transcript_14522/m.45651 type:complete len:184 (-) Transcript_14522:143-694(-)
MEINIWSCLWNLDGGPFLMRQRIPEVCVFKGCRLDGWYYSNPSGFVLRRRGDTTVGDLLQVFCAAARDASGGGGDEERAPAAILRRPSTRLSCGSELPGVPHAAVLSLRQLRQLMERVQDGLVEDDLWSVQTVVHPEDGLRVVHLQLRRRRQGEERGVRTAIWQVLRAVPAERHPPLGGRHRP